LRPPNLYVVHTVGTLGVKAGGPSRTVPALCKSLACDAAQNIDIFTGVDLVFGQNVSLTEVGLHEFPLQPVQGWVRNLKTFIIAKKETGGTDLFILHDHGQWLPINRASAIIGRNSDIPRIVTPRGMLSPWALNHRRIKKTLAWYLFARRDIQSARVIHATSDLEARELRALGVRNPIAVIPNGVEQPSPEWLSRTKKKQVLFLSRLHPKKGISELVSAWRALKLDDWTLVLAGPDESGIVDKLQLASHESIRWIGNVDGEEKWRLLSESSLFVLPSYSENFGVVVAEALMAGTPVIATYGTPWESLIEKRCGWWIDMTPQSLRLALDEATQRSESELSEMGQRGREFACTSFGWPAIASQMASVYRWTLGLGPAPDCMQFV